MLSAQVSVNAVLGAFAELRRTLKTRGVPRRARFTDIHGCPEVCQGFREGRCRLCHAYWISTTIGPAIRIKKKPLTVRLRTIPITTIATTTASCLWSLVILRPYSD